MFECGLLLISRTASASAQLVCSRRSAVSAASHAPSHHVCRRSLRSDGALLLAIALSRTSTLRWLRSAVRRGCGHRQPTPVADAHVPASLIDCGIDNQHVSQLARALSGCSSLEVVWGVLPAAVP